MWTTTEMISDQPSLSCLYSRKWFTSWSSTHWAWLQTIRNCSSRRTIFSIVLLSRTSKFRFGVLRNSRFVIARKWITSDSNGYKRGENVLAGKRSLKTTHYRMARTRDFTDTYQMYIHRWRFEYRKGKCFRDSLIHTVLFQFLLLEYNAVQSMTRITFELCNQFNCETLLSFDLQFNIHTIFNQRKLFSRKTILSVPGHFQEDYGHQRGHQEVAQRLKDPNKRRQT